MKEVLRLRAEYARRTETYMKFKSGGKAAEVDFSRKENELRRRKVSGDKEAFKESFNPRHRVILWAKPELSSLDQMDTEEEEPIRDCIEDIGTEIDFIVDRLKIEKGKKASLTDLKKELMNSLKTIFITRDIFSTSYPLTRYYSVSLYPYRSIRDLCARFRTIIQREISKLEYKKYIDETRPWTQPLHFRYLQNCLKVYDLAIQKDTSGLTWKEIRAKVWPDRKGDLRQAAQQAFKKAERVIRNVEKGVFPGN
jgi:hypothetical protein